MKRRRLKNDEAIKDEESFVEEVRAAKLATEGSKAAFYLSVGLDPEETKTKVDLTPKEFRDKCATLKGGSFRKAQMHMNSFEALFDEDQMPDEDEGEGGEEIASDDEEDLTDDGEGPEMLFIFGDEPPPAQGTTPEGKELFTREQFIEGLRKKKAEESKAAYATPEKKHKVSNRKGLLLSTRFLKNGPSSSQKPKAASTPNPTEVAASGGLVTTSQLLSRPTTRPRKC